MSQLILAQAEQTAVLARDPAAPSTRREDEDGEATVFISYSRRDLGFVDRLDADLRGRGVATLVDRDAIEIGEKWFDRLQDLIARAETILFVLSPDSVQSRVCGEEVAYGKRLGKRFIPVVARRVDTPNVPEALSELNYVFLDDEATWDAQLDRLVRAIRTDLSWMRAHADLGRTAEDWTKAGRPRGLLLGATRLGMAETWIASRPVNAPIPTDDTRALIDASRKAARQRRSGLIGALAFGLVLALGLAALAFLQRQEAIAQRTVAEQQTARASMRAAMAQRNFEVAKQTIDQVVIDLARGLRGVQGIRLSVLQTVLSRADAAMRQLQDLAVGFNDIGLERSRYVMLIEFGDTYLAAGDETGAARAYDEAVAICREFVTRAPHNESRQRDLSVALTHAGGVKFRTGDAKGSLAAYEEALAITRRLVERHPGAPDLSSALANALDGIGDAKLRLGDTTGALAAFEESLSITRALVRRDPGHAGSQSDLSLALVKIADLKVQAGDPAGALALYEESLGIDRALARADPSRTQLQRDVLLDLSRIADLKRQLSDASGALALYQEALAIARTLTRNDPGNAGWQRDLLFCLANTGGTQRILKDFPGALASYEEALAIATRLGASGLARGEGARDKENVAGGLGNLAYEALLGRDDMLSLRASEMAIEAAPTLLWLQTNRAHALMLLGRVDEARMVYLRYRGRPARRDKLWETVVIGDFAELRQAGISHPLMAEIEATFKRSNAG